MEYRNIRTFVTIAQLGSFTKTAQKLGYSQSAVTMQMQQLEEELQVKLFDRIGRSIYLTDKGKDLLEYGDQILKLNKQAIEVISNDREPRGTLKIGMAESLSSAYLPVIIESFQEQCEHVEVIILNDEAPELINKLKRNDLDIVFILDQQINDKKLIKAYEKKEEIVYVGPSQSNDNITSMKQLVDRPFIMTEKGFGYRHAFDELADSKGWDINVRLEIGNTEIIKQLVIKGLGYSLLPKFTIHNEFDNKLLNILSIQDNNINVWSQLLYHKDRWLSPQIKIFIDLINDIT